jgi:uncharacterized protein with PQ loop repeat
MRAGYGEKLRKLFVEKSNPKLLLDFGGTQIFDSATVDTNILLFAKEKNCHQTVTRIVQSIEELKKSESQSVDCSQRIVQSFSLSAWTILSPIEQSIKHKIEAVGTPLSEWNISTYIGICTGCNDAFVIDGNKRAELIAADPKSEEIIKPLLRGKDIKRYVYEFADQWLIATFPVMEYDINDYPAVRDYLVNYGIQKLEASGKPGARKKGKNKWFQISDAVAYWEKFSEDKIVWTDIATEPSFVSVKDEFFLLNTCSMIVEAPRYLIGILNSKLVKWYFPKIASDLGEKATRYIKSFVLQIPALQVSDTKIEKRIEKLLVAKDFDKIDALVYELYNLSDEEIAVVEGKS